MGVHRIDFPSVLSSAEDKAFVKGYSDPKTSDDRLWKMCIALLRRGFFGKGADGWYLFAKCLLH